VKVDGVNTTLMAALDVPKFDPAITREAAFFA
jgi:hypothetical protein